MDAHMEGGWRDRADAISAAEENGLVCESVGWIIQESPHYLLLAPTRSSDTVDLVADTLQIPTGCILPGGVRKLSEESHLRAVDAS